MKVLNLQQLPGILKTHLCPFDAAVPFIRMSVAIGVFVALFLLVFRPFGITLNSNESWLIIAGLGTLNTSLILINHFGIRPVFVRANFLKMSRQVNKKAWGVWQLLTICLGNYFYIGILYGFSVQFIPFIGKVLLIAMIPKTFLMLYSRIKELEKRHHDAAPISEMTSIRNSQQKIENRLVICSESGNETLQMTSYDLLYLRAEDNYVRITFLKNGNLKQVLLRSSLKNIENQLSGLPVKRCHRSYLVNLMHVTGLRGNAQGMTMSLKENGTTIPVSRKYIDSVKRAIRLLS